MTEPVLVLSPSMSHRPQPILTAEKKDSLTKTREECHEATKGKKMGEVAGGTAAECAAVCCCCPFAVMNLVVLAVYKVPAGLCKKAWRNKQKKRQHMVGKRKKQAGGLLKGPTGVSGVHHHHHKQELLVAANAMKNEKAAAQLELELEKEMWDQFHNHGTTGFWRSPSQIESESESETEA